MNKKIFALLLLFLAILPVTAQPQQNWQNNQHWNQQNPQPGNPQNKQNNNAAPKFDPEEFTKRMEGYIAIKAGLTKEESEKFFPIYREFKAKQRDLTFKQQRLQREKPAKDSDYDNVITQIAKLSVQIAQLEQTYFPKMCRVVPAKKVHAVLQAESDFHRDMIRQPMQMGGIQRPQQWGNGQRPQTGGQNNTQRPQQWGNGQRPQQWGGQGQRPGNNGQQKK